jgi:membrane-bound metal-dependent hydrolase YbcI (DUF457 family)
MDTITHGIVGALAGKAFFAGRDVPARSLEGAWNDAQSSPAARAAILGCTVGSIFPDIDIFAGRLARNPLAIMEWHRNITHSLVMLPVWAALLAAVSLPLARWLHWKMPSFPRLFGICAVGLATHVFLDLVTSFGTMVWSPLQYSRPAWDWVFILDLTLTAIALVPQLAAWCYREPGKFERRAAAVWAALTTGAFGAYALAATAGYGFPIWVVGVVSAVIALVLFVPAIQGAGFRWSKASWCRAGLALLCAYLALAGALHGKALADVNDFAAAHHLPGKNRAALPLPPTFTHWAGLISTPEGVWRTTFHEPGGVIEGMQFYSDAQSDRYVEEAKKLRDVQVYLWFARFPIWHVRQQEGQTVVEISDLRFFREEEPGANAESRWPARSAGIRTNPAGFTFEVVFNDGGRVISQGFKKPQP